MIFRARAVLLAGAVGAVTALAGVATLAVASAAPQTRVAAARAGADDVSPPYAIEDFGYPGADKILAEKGIALRKGDGHILLADCGATSQIQIWTRQNNEGRYCFRVIGKTGNLTLEVKDVHAVQTEERAVRASLTVNGKTTAVDVPKDDYKPVGEGDIKNPTPAVLVELKVTG
ncbi:hypothetical protein FBY35_6921 [Streptomyces sp. SLBN-118]|uniref:hypothetical protein n=1 Tax=Streptomyces sp. SLBN-118 TaxID=2768454 RepID=UPI0011712B72|nr:hypothetical protein [Streptomyces sp. SLBN-118]TQK45360.1 hypothetical protein FBY35_6921 [Streptomyces sp. SLBN-118]